MQRHQEGLETKMKRSGFPCDSVDFLYYHLHKTSFKRGGWYGDYHEWLKNKKATLNPKKYDNNCFQYAITAVLNHNNIKKSISAKNLKY